MPEHTFYEVPSMWTPIYWITSHDLVNWGSYKRGNKQKYLPRDEYFTRLLFNTFQGSLNRSPTLWWTRVSKQELALMLSSAILIYFLKKDLIATNLFRSVQQLY